MYIVVLSGAKCCKVSDCDVLLRIVDVESKLSDLVRTHFSTVMLLISAILGGFVLNYA